MSGGGKGGGAPSPPPEIGQASLRMAKVGEGYLALAQEERELLKNVYAPKILEMQTRAADAQFNLATMAARQAEEAWRQYTGTELFRNVLKADASGYLDMSDKQAERYANKLQKTAISALQKDQAAQWKAGLAGIKSDYETKIDKYIADHRSQTRDGGAGGEPTLAELIRGDTGKKDRPFDMAPGLKKIREQRAREIEEFKRRQNRESRMELGEITTGQDLSDYRKTALANEARAGRRAQSEINAAIASQAEAERIELARMGITPGTTRYFRARGPSTLQAAGLAGAASNQARLAARGEMVGKAGGIVNLGMGFPAQAENATRTAMAGFGQGGATYGQGVGQIAQAQRVPLEYAQTGIQSMQAGISGLNQAYGNQLAQYQAQPQGGSILGGILGAAGGVLGTMASGGSGLALWGGGLLGAASGYSSR